MDAGGRTTNDRAGLADGYACIDVTGVRAHLEVHLAAIDDVVVSESMFGHGDAYWVNGKEVAHFEDDGVIELRLTKAEISARRPELKADERVVLRPSGAEWITIHVATAHDAEFVAGLMAVAVAAHRPPRGVSAAPPPSGPELRRRQRFH